MENHLDVKAFGSQRIASRIGTGAFNNVYGVNGSYVTAGQQDYAERMNQIQSQKEAYYKELGIAPGVPTEKGAYGDPENTGVGYNTIITNLGDHSVPEDWVQTPKHNNEQGSNPGAPISWNEPSNPEDPQAGYGYIPNDTTMEETFFFHSDHLGSTSYITDDKGNITQYDAYLPYGELLVDEHSSSEDLPYKFNGKEFDEETGLYYYGARYYEPRLSLWMSTDPKQDEAPNRPPYNYTLNNPIKFVDPNGEKPRIYVERMGAGHAFITIGEGKNTIVYTYGRYLGGGKGKSSANSLDPKGKGVLIRLTGKEAQRYIKHELSDMKAKVYELSDASDNKSQKYLDAMFAKGRALTRVEAEQYNKKTSRFGSSNDARVIDQYDLLNNNCTIKAIAGAKAGGTKEDFLEDGGYVPVPNGPHIVYQPSTPAGVDSHLAAKSKIKGSPVIDVTSKMNKEIKESGYAR